MSYIPRLITFYANTPIAEIKKDRERWKETFGSSLEQLIVESGFSEQKELVEQQKKIVEAVDADDDIATVKVQVSRSLKEAFRFIMFAKGAPAAVAEKMDVLRALILERYATNDRWSAPQRAHFDFVFERLKEWNTYFLSYTNEGGKDVNERFKEVIERKTQPEVLAVRDRTLHNVLADAIVNQLRKRLGGRRSFYDKENIAGGANIEAAIRPATAKTFAFVQLVQVDTFDATRDPNWPWEEYRLFDSSIESELEERAEYRAVYYDRFTPVLTASKTVLQLKNPPWDYLLWSQRIFKDAHYLELPTPPDAFDIAMTELSDVVVNLTHKIIDNVP
jgi:hypothetical protein